MLETINVLMIQVVVGTLLHPPLVVFQARRPPRFFYARKTRAKWKKGAREPSVGATDQRLAKRPGAPTWPRGALLAQ